MILGEVLGSGAFGQVVKAEAIGILGFSPRDKSGEAFKRRSKLRRSMRAKANDEANSWKFAKTTVAVKTLKGECLPFHSASYPCDRSLPAPEKQSQD